MQINIQFRPIISLILTAILSNFILSWIYCGGQSFTPEMSSVRRHCDVSLVINFSWVAVLIAGIASALIVYGLAYLFVDNEKK